VTPAELLELHDREVRGSFPHRLPAGWTGEQDGLLTRCLTPQGGFAMFVADPADLTTAELEDLVARTFAFYAERGRRFEWKTFEHDRQDLVPLLVAHGAVAEPRESLVLGESAVLAGEVRLADGLTMRSVTSRADLERVAAFESDVWDEDWAWLADDLAGRLAADQPAEVLVVDDGDLVVSAAWLVPLAGTRVAGLWGGSTLAAYRGLGVYRSLVAHRARRALDRGFPLLQVDASEDSRPILERLGLHAVGGTVPYETPQR
jgi:GNAT superfamily N-acetyltransferase